MPTPSPNRRIRNFTGSNQRRPPSLRRSRSVRRRVSSVTPRRLTWANQPRGGSVPVRRVSVNHMRQHNSVAVGINSRGQLVVIQNP